jgi:predicted dehydrogenase
MGVVGAGSWVQMPIRVHLRHLSADFVVICDHDDERTAKPTKEFGVPEFFCNLDGIL